MAQCPYNRNEVVGKWYENPSMHEMNIFSHLHLEIVLARKSFTIDGTECTVCLPFISTWQKCFSVAEQLPSVIQKDNTTFIDSVNINMILISQQHWVAIQVKETNHFRSSIK